MVIENMHGRIVGLPEHMEESGFQQARRVISISKNLMEGREPYDGLRSTFSATSLRDQILAKFPDVITDDEYYAGLESKAVEAVEVVEAVEAVEVESDEPNIEELTKPELIEYAERLGIELTTADKRKKKAEIIDMIEAELP